MSRKMTLLSILFTFLFPGVSGQYASAGYPPSDSVRVTIIATSDVHGSIYPFDYYAEKSADIGLAKVATVVRKIRDEKKNVILLDCGDTIEGTPLTYFFSTREKSAPNPIVLAMNYLKYDCMTVGNHDFNFGFDILRKVKKEANFPFLAANIADTTAKSLFQPYVIKEISGVRIGILGLTTPAVTLWENPRNLEGIKFLDTIESVKAAVKTLREKERVNAVLLAAHMGLENDAQTGAPRVGALPGENQIEKIIAQVPGIDCVIMAHTHELISDQRLGEVLATQPGFRGKYVSEIDLVFANENGTLTLARKASSLVPVEGIGPDAKLLSLVSTYHEKTQKYLNTVVAEAVEPLSGLKTWFEDTALLDLIQNAQLDGSGADVSLAAALTPCLGIDKGPVTIRELSALYPYHNTLCVVEVTAGDLKRELEYSSAKFGRYDSGPFGGGFPAAGKRRSGLEVAQGISYRIDLREPEGRRIADMTLNGKPLQPGDKIKLAVNSYQLRSAESPGLRDAKPISQSSEDVRGMLIDFARKKESLHNDCDSNWSVFPDYVTSDASREIDLLLRLGEIKPDKDGKINPDSLFQDGSTKAEHLRKKVQESFVTLSLLQTTDFHGSLLGGGTERSTEKPWGGAAVVARYIEKARERNPAGTFLFDCGDMWQGTPISNLSFGKPVVEYMNMAKYDASALGNHDFDWGIDTLRARIREQTFPMLAANVVEKKTRKIPSFLKPYVILERGGLKVAVIGLATPETPVVTLPTNVASLDFTDPAKAVNDLVPQLRNMGAQVIVVLAHFGGQQRGSGEITGEIGDLAKAVSGVDAIFGGHTHTFVAGQAAGIPVVIAASNGRAIGEILLTYDLRKQKVVESFQRITKTYVEDISMPKGDNFVLRIAQNVAQYQERIGPLMERVVGSAENRLSRSDPSLANFVTDCMRGAVSADIAVTNSGGLRTDIEPGNITVGEVYELMPFDNTLVTMKLTGEQVKRFIEEGGGRVRVSGLKGRVDFSKPEGQRVEELLLENGKPVEPLATYIVVANDFIVAGGDGFKVFQKGKDVTNTQRLIRDELIKCVESQARAGKKIKADFTSRLVNSR
ncbi:MAG: 5'-nucleotidase C-terminal domain-containing protein [Candidatus Eisenbacteria bacterium]|nr:5'-nucleotidase C-terminal domain-containing protein [Candidatus Eisenbacteria bacterium]